MSISIKIYKSNSYFIFGCFYKFQGRYRDFNKKEVQKL